MAYKIKPACNEFHKFCIEKKPNISKYDQRFASLEATVGRLPELIGRRGYVQDLNKCLAQLHEDAASTKSHVIHNDVLKILLNKEFQEFILFFSTLRPQLEATYFTVIDEVGRLDTIVAQSRMPIAAAASDTSVITPQLLAMLAFPNTTHIIPLPQNGAILCYAEDTQCLWNSMFPSDNPCLTIKKFTPSQAVVNIEERLLFMLGQHSGKPCLLIVSLFDDYKLTACPLTNDGFLYASTDGKIYLLLITGEIFFINEQGSLKKTADLCLGALTLTIKHLSFVNNEWHLIGVIMKHLTYFNLTADWNIRSSTRFYACDTHNTASLNVVADDICDTIYFQNASLLHGYQKSTKALRLIRPDLEIRSLFMLNQNELLIVYKNGFFAHFNIPAKTLINILTPSNAINVFTIKKIKGIATAYYTVEHQLYKVELGKCD